MTTVSSQTAWLVTAALISLLLFAGVGTTIRLFVQNRRLTLDLTDAEKHLNEQSLVAARLEERLAATVSTLGESRENQQYAGAELADLRAQQAEDQDRHHETETRLHKRNAELETELTRCRRETEEKLAVLANAREELSLQFRNLAGEILEEKTRKFTDSNRANMSGVLDPLREQLKEFKRRVEDSYDKESKDRVSLTLEIEKLKNLNERISSDAVNLTNALLGDSKQRGTWGEIKLQRLLEDSGLTRDLEYEVQSPRRDETGQRFQPDVIVHLPDGKDVIIDSKVSLVAYDRYHGEEQGPAREQALRRHIASMRRHIKDLSGKCYEDLAGIHSLDLVLMFVPIEPALMLALEHEPGLFAEAFEQRIVLVSPSTMVATLRIVHNIWRTERQNKNALEIARQAGALHDKFVSFAEDLDNIGKSLDKARETWEQASDRLRRGRGNLLSRVDGLKELGAKAKKALPDNWVEESTPTSIQLSTEQPGKGSSLS